MGRPRFTYAVDVDELDAQFGLLNDRLERANFVVTNRHILFAWLVAIPCGSAGEASAILESAPAYDFPIGLGNGIARL